MIHKLPSRPGKKLVGAGLVALTLILATHAALDFRGSLLWNGGPRLVRRLDTILLDAASRVLQFAGIRRPGLRLVQTVFTSHGNAAGLAWSDDGKKVFLANEEGRMSAVEIDATDVVRPRIVKTQGIENFLFAVAKRGEILVFQPSIGNDTIRLDPKGLAVVWRRRTGTSHAIATDGSRIYVAREGKPGALIVLRADGRELSRLEEPDGWAQVYGIAYAAVGGTLCVAASDDSSKGIPGGIYIYAPGDRVLKRGRIPRPAGNVAVYGTRVWTDTDNTLETWQIADPLHPRRAGIWDLAVQEGPGGTPVRLQLGALALNRAGTRLYAAYHYVTARDGNNVSDWLAGFMIFDVAQDTPELIGQQDWKFSGSNRLAPTSIALSPDDATLAVSYWRYGIRFFAVQGDRVIPRGDIATAGEAHDVYVDQRGILYVFGNETMQIIDPRTNRHLRDFPLATGGDGGWKPFRDGAVVLRGPEPMIVSPHDGTIAWQDFPNLGTYIWDNAYSNPYLYSAGENGTLFVQRIDSLAAGKYGVRLVGSAQVPRADDRTGTAPLLAVVKEGSFLWGLGPTVGTVVFDTHRPEAPRLVMHDKFTFEANGNHAGLVVTSGRVYAGAGSAGVRIYDPATFRRTGSISGLNVDFLDVAGNGFLVVANYWYPRLPEGMYVYDPRSSPDAPVFVDRFPRPGGNSNFRARAFGRRIYRVALYGIDILENP
jgi:hypothetical protein